MKSTLKREAIGPEIVEREGFGIKDCRVRDSGFPVKRRPVLLGQVAASIGCPGWDTTMGKVGHGNPCGSLLCLL